jgi:hypothetical protein
MSPPAASRPCQRRTVSGIELPRTDGRKIHARRYRRLIETFEAELSGQLSEADKALCRQAAALTLRAEQVQCDVVNGLAVDADALVRISSEARRILGLLRSKGMKHRPPAPTMRERLLGGAA